jgi:tetratricopeptide (TPR) repeat protein
VAKRKRTSHKKIPVAKQSARVFQLSYNVTAEPIEDPDYEELPDDIQCIFENLYHQIPINPTKALLEILYWKEQYPDLPKLHNFLSAVYSHLGDKVNLYKNIEATYRAFPTYLFARINYAELCLQEKRYEQIPQIFHNTFDLGLLYPERTCFHVSEFGSFAGVIGLYYYHTRNFVQAQHQYTLLLQIAPDHPLTQKLGQALATLEVIQTILNTLESDLKKH